MINKIKENNRIIIAMANNPECPSYENLPKTEKDKKNTLSRVLNAIHINCDERVIYDVANDRIVLADDNKFSVMNWNKWFDNIEEQDETSQYMLNKLLNNEYFEKYDQVDY